jgi:ribose 5-phosphate isomerase
MQLALTGLGRMGGNRVRRPLRSGHEPVIDDRDIGGADEVDPDRYLLKGAGGALRWEKIVASCSRRLVIVVDHTKLVGRLGDGHPLPWRSWRSGGARTWTPCARSAASRRFG